MNKLIFRALGVFVCCFNITFYSINGIASEVLSENDGDQVSKLSTLNAGIIYSVDDELCNYVQKKLYENTVIPYKLMSPISNDPFGTVNWNVIGKNFRGEIAVFDINNDGEKETVINREYYSDDIPVNELEVFKSGTVIRDHEFNELKYSELYKSSARIGSIDLIGRTYCLEKCKENNQCSSFTSEDFQLLNSGSWEWCPFSAFTVVPFIYKEKAYIAFRDGFTLQPIDRENIWIIVSEYKGGHVTKQNHRAGEPTKNKDVLEDMCYLKQ